MSEQLTPFVSPDSVRKTFQLLNRFYDGYTKKNVGYTDIKGLKYAGTSENFGSEIYFEARKMRMKRPPIDMVFFHNDFGFYFNIMYSELIETYDQQTMIVATLKGESLLSNKRYDIIFSNCNEETVLRAESWGDPEVKRDSFITTETAPILRITNADNTHTDVSLVATCGRILKYCFHRNLTNARMYTYDETNHILTVENITKRQNNIPLIWILSTDFNTLPDIGFFNNIDKNGKPLLTVGTDGQSVSRLYPYVYEDNYPAAFDPDDGLHWFLKLKPTDETSFVGSGLSADEEVIIQYFEYIRAENPWSEPTITHIVTYSTSYTNIHLNNGSEWQYHTPQEGDYDYDGTTFVNRMYAYKNIDTLPDMHPLFKVKFNANFLNTFEAELIDETSGLHIGTCSDYSDNGILKKNGTIHNLGDFDGLPRYFKSFEDKTQHRSHVEMYAIRDEINSSRQRAKDKQTAAILIDSGLPKKDVEDYYNDMKVLIKYNMETDGEFYTEEEAMDMKDVMSSLVYVDDHNFGEEHLPGYFSLPHFIYHGKGVFSLTMSELDPELEYGRVYIISNDSTTYENNNLTENPKPDRTFARICDIPTIFSQLIHITGYAPTILIDKKYIHSNASYNETDKDRLVNGMQSRWVTCYHDIDGEEKQYSNMGFFLSRNNMDLMIGKNTREFKSYTRKVNLNPSISYSDCTVSVADAGYDFNVDDTFTFYVGGILEQVLLLRQT